MEPATTDRIQRMIDAEATERFPPGAVPQLALLHYGDHPVIEPGELYLRVFLGQDGATWDAWTEEHFGRLKDLRAQRLPEVKGFMFTTDAPGSAGLRPNRILMMCGISLLDPEEDEVARGLTPMLAKLGPADLATLDVLVTAGIAASRAEGVRWAVARIREQPVYAQLSERAREPGEPQPRAGLDRAALDQLQRRLDGQVREHFPDGGVQRVTLLQYGDDPSVEPGELLVRVFIEDADENRSLQAWHRDHETMTRELHPEIAEQLPGAGYLELFWSGDNGRTGQRSVRLGAPPDDPAGSERDLTPTDIRLGPADLEMLDALITTGTAASRAEAVGWVLARIRERPAYARLSERARELDQLKAHF
jgi:Arc/MetJ-type ribon-helix-helix transcriptional regulator